MKFGIVELLLVTVVIVFIITSSSTSREGFWVNPKCACSCNYGQPNLGLTNNGLPKSSYSTPFGYYSPE